MVKVVSLVIVDQMKTIEDTKFVFFSVEVRIHDIKRPSP